MTQGSRSAPSTPSVLSGVSTSKSTNRRCHPICSGWPASADTRTASSNAWG